MLSCIPALAMPVPQKTRTRDNKERTGGKDHGCRSFEHNIVYRRYEKPER
jgi:hypothetical protein